MKGVGLSCRLPRAAVFGLVRCWLQPERSAPHPDPDRSIRQTVRQPPIQPCHNTTHNPISQFMRARRSDRHMLMASRSATPYFRDFFCFAAGTGVEEAATAAAAVSISKSRRAVTGPADVRTRGSTDCTGRREGWTGRCVIGVAAVMADGISAAAESESLETCTLQA